MSAAAAARMMHSTRMTILLSLNAVVILVVGIMIVSAINMNGGLGAPAVVNERSDVVAINLETTDLIAPGLDEMEAAVAAGPGDEEGGAADSGAVGGGMSSEGQSTGGSSSSASGGKLASNELWAQDAITIYQTADFDICVDSSISSLGDMYWQTSNTSVIKGFASSTRTWLGYEYSRCRYPVIVGTGTTVITAGTNDGARRDKITVTVVAPPIEQWKRDVLTLVNQERAKNGLAALSWGTTCEAAANLRAREIMTTYSHTRPDGTQWSTACPIPQTGGKSGENLNVGNAAVSPQTVVASWMNSPEHRANILDPDFKYLSVGFIFDPNSKYKTHWSQYFTTY